METEHNIKLTSAEIAELWSCYMTDSMAICVLSYFLNKVEDTQIKEVIEYALGLSQKHLVDVKAIMQGENFPIPKGFTMDDVNVNAPRLYSDTFFLIYLKNLGKLGLVNYAIALGHMTREDTCKFFTDCVTNATALSNMASKVMLSKGVYIKPPHVPSTESAEFVQKESFLNGWFGDKRPLNVMEISHLYLNIQTNALGKALLIGFAQTAQNDAVRDFMIRGKEIATKHVKEFSLVLTDDDIPAPMTWDTDIMDSKEPPFSDKLLMYHTVSLIASGLGNYGFAMAQSMRRDLSAMYGALMAEIGAYADDGAKLMIEKDWLEKIPQAPDRKALIQA
ncbi:DUF3231 family protein [Paenibacillus cremeus]|uniref:DUF3231 family protein n=1 Tax=Paenibacillus cremeus TaxID=2163881 RepID=A0A559K7A4_9BACL|nr:DUF3231 family protein [Paenibacillus cremeus]TVY08006.1 DUF3231 family protein [Paenibacillus cremeus]